jgi:retinoblastoma-associated protein
MSVEPAPSTPKKSKVPESLATVPSAMYQTLSAISLDLSLSSRRKSTALSLLRVLITEYEKSSLGDVQQSPDATRLVSPVRPQQIDQNGLIITAVFCSLYDIDQKQFNAPVFRSPASASPYNYPISAEPSVASLLHLITAFKINLSLLCETLKKHVPVLSNYGVVSATLMNDCEKLHSFTLKENMIFDEFVINWKSHVITLFPVGASNSKAEASSLQNTFLGLGWLIFVLAKSKLVSTGSNSEQEARLLLFCVVRFLRIVVKGGINESDIEIGSKEDWRILCKGDSELVRLSMQMNVTGFIPFLGELFAKSANLAKLGLQQENLSDLKIIESVALMLQSVIFEKKLDNLDSITEISNGNSRIKELVQSLGCIYDKIVSQPIGSFTNSALWVDERIILQEYFKKADVNFLPTFMSSIPMIGKRKHSNDLQYNDAFSPVIRSPSSSPSRFINSLRNPSLLGSASSLGCWTPFSKIEESVTWLTSVVSKGPSTASLGLTSMLKQHDKDEKETCLGIMEDVLMSHMSKLHKIIESLGEHDSESWTFKQELALKLFYRFMEAICTYETDRVKKSSSGLSVFLKKKSFYSALFSLSLEVIIDAYRYKVSKLGFPELLPTFSLSVLDFWKVIESTLKSDPEIPDSIRGHIIDIETKIICHLIWSSKTNSDPFPLSEESTKKLLIDQFEGSAEVQRSKPVGKNFALIVVYRALLRRARQRILDLMKWMSSVPISVYELSPVLLQHCLLHNSELLINNHLDVLILCSIYAVSRIAKADDLKFQTIISSYIDKYPKNKNFVMKLPHHDVHIIQFYNSTFLPAVKQFVVSSIKSRVSDFSKSVTSHSALDSQENSPSSDVDPASPVVKRSRSNLSFSPRYRIDPKMNVYVSPLRRPFGSSSLDHLNIGVSSLLTPQSSYDLSSAAPIYAFGESPARTLQLINQKLQESQSSEAKSS